MAELSPDGRGGGDILQRDPRRASAARCRDVDRPEFSCGSVSAPVESAVHHQPGADPGADRDGDEVEPGPIIHALGFRHRGQVHVVLDGYRHSEPRGEFFPDG